MRTIVALDLSSYANSCHAVASYQSAVLEFVQPSFQSKPDWYDNYISRFNRVATDPIKWSNQLVQQLISVPQYVVSSAAQVKSHFAAVDDDCTDLSDQDAIDDARTQLQAITHVITTVVGECRSLINNLQQYYAVAVGIDRQVLQEGVTLTAQQLAADAQSMAYLSADIANLKNHINDLEDWWPFTSGKIDAAKKKLANEETEYRALQNDQPVLQRMNDSFNTMVDHSTQAASSLEIIVNQWVCFLDNLQQLQVELDEVIDSLSQPSQIVSIFTDMSKSAWNDLVSTSRDLVGISYT